MSRQAGAGQTFTAPDPVITGGSTFGPAVPSPREPCAFPNAQPLRLRLGHPMIGKGIAPGTGVYLDDRRA